MVVRKLLTRGMIAGLVAGLLAFAFARIFGEPQVQHAIDFESYLAHLHHEHEGPALVSRGVQRSWGLLTGTVVMGIALGGGFALAYAYAYGRLGGGRLGARATAVVLAACAFVTITLVPDTKYPANPPTIGNPETIGRRTLLYFAMIAVTVLAAVAAARVRRDLLPRLRAFDAGLVAVAAFLAIIVVVELVLPGVHETPKGFSADVLWRFRLSSLGINLTLWTGVALVFGVLAERVLEPGRARSRRPAGAAAPDGA